MAPEADRRKLLRVKKYFSEHFKPIPSSVMAGTEDIFQYLLQKIVWFLFYWNARDGAFTFKLKKA